MVFAHSRLKQFRGPKMIEIGLKTLLQNGLVTQMLDIGIVRVLIFVTIHYAITTFSLSSKIDVNFDKQGACATCSAQGTFKPCKARKYVGKKGSMYMVYHIGNHDCNSNPKPSRPRNIVSKALSQDPMVKPCKIQSNFIISAIRNRESWRNVLEKVSKVTDEKAISNEKVKQNKHIYNFGFDAVVESKAYLDEKGKLLVYNIDESAGTVFKTSTAKMKMAENLDMDKEHFLNKEFIFFDGKVKRTKNFTTLTASIYHSLLRKPLSTMECPSEDITNVVQFWKLFENAFKEANGSEALMNPHWLLYRYELVLLRRNKDSIRRG